MVSPLTVCSQDTGEPGWWRGEIGGKQGVFPDNFVIMVSEAEKEVRCGGTCRQLPGLQLDLVFSQSFPLVFCC